MIPGMYHCSGGPGADQVGGAGGDAPVVDGEHDLLSALEKWVEKGVPPVAMIASKVEGQQVSRTSLICPYPQQARYRRGDPLSAASFACQAPKRRGTASPAR
jgi:feruloyl esterase